MFYRKVFATIWAIGLLIGLATLSAQAHENEDDHTVEHSHPGGEGDHSEMDNDHEGVDPYPIGEVDTNDWSEWNGKMHCYEIEAHLRVKVCVKPVTPKKWVYETHSHTLNEDHTHDEPTEPDYEEVNTHDRSIELDNENGSEDEDGNVVTKIVYVEVPVETIVEVPVETIVEVPVETIVEVPVEDDSNSAQTNTDSAPPQQISFSELMFASEGGFRSSPQWIELYNNSDSLTINISGLKLTIEARDEDGTHRYGEILLKDSVIEPESTILVATWRADNSGHFENNKYLLNRHWIEFEQNTHRNMALGLSGFYMKLESTNGVIIDEIGNIDGKERTQDLPRWQIPDEVKDVKNRVSLVRKYDVSVNMPLNGKSKKNWMPASNFTDSSEMYWGNADDIGTPGYRNKDKALPVELSHFSARLVDSDVLISWTTESELNNAGFNILRSKNKNMEFEPINASLIVGQGTTGNRTEYSWSDKTAKPNTQYYYRIQEVSLDGQVQEISQVRMKGYLSPTNKLITNWGSIKRQQKILRFIYLGEYGRLMLLRCPPEKLEIISQAVPKDKNGSSLVKYPAWAAPVLADGYLYIRGKDRLICFDLRSSTE